MKFIENITSMFWVSLFLSFPFNICIVLRRLYSWSKYLKKQEQWRHKCHRTTCNWTRNIIVKVNRTYVYTIQHMYVENKNRRVKILKEYIIIMIIFSSSCQLINARYFYYIYLSNTFFYYMFLLYTNTHMKAWKGSFLTCTCGYL